MRGFRQKGQDNERAQAKAISLWLSEGHDDSLLWRSDASGARSSTGKIQGAQYGDLSLSKHEGKYVPDAQNFLSLFSVELKHVKHIDLLRAWLNPGDDLRKYWEQCTKDSDSNKVNPMLIVRINNVKPVVFFRATLSPTIIKLAPSIERFSLLANEFKVVGFKQSEFFSLIKWKVLYNILK